MAQCKVALKQYWCRAVKLRAAVVNHVTHELVEPTQVLTDLATLKEQLEYKACVCLDLSGWRNLAEVFNQQTSHCVSVKALHRAISLPISDWFSIAK
jgi:hypothetical protein